jgi:hypothetical protein
LADTRVSPTAEAQEAATFAALFDAARRRQQAAREKSPLIPRFLMESAQSMAGHMAMSDARMQECLGPMALWQLYLPSLFSTTLWDFAAIRRGLPWSYEQARLALEPLRDRPQLVLTVFHMAMFPLVSTLLGTVLRDLDEGPLHLLVASRNMGFLRVGHNRWINDEIEVVSTDSAGLRQLLAGLKDGSIRRLLILADGPQAPGRPGTRALDQVSPTLGIRTSLLSKIHDLGIPAVPFTHEWEHDRLVITPGPLLDPARLSEAESIDAIVGHIEERLRRHPEQWLNWSAARIRT